MNRDTKLEQLFRRMGELAKEDLCIAFSGGVDSSLILKAAATEAKNRGTKVYAVMISTRLMPAADLEIAREVSKECGSEFHILHLDESGCREILENCRERCYHCKKYMFQRLKDWAGERGIRHVAEGTNADDLKVYRPGIRAVRELEIQSPLAELYITKMEVRDFAKSLGLSVAKRPSAPCMATRIPYGTPLDFEVLKRLEKGEEICRQMGYETVRLRLHDKILRVEIEKEQMGKFLEESDKIAEKLRQLKFQYITLDIEGFRSGSMDE